MRMTDAKSGRILAHSKADGVCKKEDTSCRLDDITAGIDGLIRKEFPDQKSVEPIDNAKRAFDEKKSAESISKWLDSL